MASLRLHSPSSSDGGRRSPFAPHRSQIGHWAANRCTAPRVLIPAILVTLVVLSYRMHGHSAAPMHIYVSSAFQVHENGRTLIRALAVAEDGFSGRNLRCDVGDQRRAARVHRIGGYPSCKWASYFLECQPIRPDDVQSFELVALNGREDGDGIAERHEIPISAVDSTPRRLVVCFSRMFYFENWQVLLLSLHLHKLHGVDLMVLPLASLLEPIYRLLAEYEADGWVRLKRAPRIPLFADLDYDPNTEIEWFNQVLSYNECLYEYRDAAEFVAFIDVDDVLFPRYHDSLYEELAALASRHPSVGSFEFRWGLASAQTAREPARLDLERSVRTTHLIYHLPFGKSIVRPRRVNQGYIHHPEMDRSELLNGFTDQMMENTTFVVHFRRMIYDNFAEDRNVSNAFFAHSGRYDVLNQQFHSFLHRRPQAEKALRRLPTEMRHYSALSRCYSKYARQIQSSALSRCPNPVRCIPQGDAINDLQACVALDYEYNITRISGRITVATPSSATLVLKPNCLT